MKKTLFFSLLIAASLVSCKDGEKASFETTITPATQKIVEGLDATLTATTIDVNTKQTVTKELTWTSNNEKVAKVNNGKVTAVHAGTTNIQAVAEDGKAGVANITVTVPSIKNIEWYTYQAYFVTDMFNNFMKAFVPKMNVGFKYQHNSNTYNTSYTEQYSTVSCTCNALDIYPELALNPAYKSDVAKDSMRLAVYITNAKVIYANGESTQRPISYYMDKEGNQSTGKFYIINRKIEKGENLANVLKELNAIRYTGRFVYNGKVAYLRENENIISCDSPEAKKDL